MFVRLGRVPVSMFAVLMRGRRMLACFFVTPLLVLVSGAAMVVGRCLVVGCCVVVMLGCRVLCHDRLLCALTFPRLAKNALRPRSQSAQEGLAAK
jgi:hypothetical protein